MQELYSEGRIVGLSAYELYVRNHLAQNPDQPPASEIEWLASTIAMGSSMLLKIKAGTDKDVEGPHYIDFKLPPTSKLGAANTLIASWFLGDGNFGNESAYSAGYDHSGRHVGLWASEVTDFGPLIGNQSNAHPSYPNFPLKDHLVQPKEFSKDERKQLESYIMISDGVVLQPGQWTKNPVDNEPYMDVTADMSVPPTIRIYFADKLKSDFCVIFTGFTLRSVLSGVSGVESALNTNNPADGDFLGPPIFPWSAKVLFTMPSAAAYFLLKINYFRQIPKNSTMEEVETGTLVDMNAINPEDYYRQKNELNSTVPYYINKFSTMMEGLAVVTIYSKNNNLYPPAIWGTRVKKNDTDGQDEYLCPLDVVAPGTIKMFKNGDAATLQQYENTYPGTFGMSKNDKGQIFVLNSQGQLVPAAKLSIQTLTYPKTDWNTTWDIAGIKNTATATTIEAGDDSSLVLSIGKGLNSSQYEIGNKLQAAITTDMIRGTLFNSVHDFDYNMAGYVDNIEWASLLACLANNVGLDILGAQLKFLKYGLDYNYIQLPWNHSNDGRESTPDSLRLYISSQEPKPVPGSGIPIGSIGIGW